MDDGYFFPRDIHKGNLRKTLCTTEHLQGQVVGKHHAYSWGTSLILWVACNCQTVGRVSICRDTFIGESFVHSVMNVTTPFKHWSFVSSMPLFPVHSSGRRDEQHCYTLCKINHYMIHVRPNAWECLYTGSYDKQERWTVCLPTQQHDGHEWLLLLHALKNKWISMSLE